MMRVILTASLVVALFASTLELVRSRHMARQRFVELRSLDSNAKELEREWTRLLLEQATLGAHRRVEQVAREQLGMTTPAATRVSRVAP